jgi:hypothetical protein
MMLPLSIIPTKIQGPQQSFCTLLNTISQTSITKHNHTGLVLIIAYEFLAFVVTI